MDTTRLLYSCLCVILLSTTDVLSVQLTLSSTTSPAVLGNPYVLYCQYTLDVSERILTISLLRKQTGEATFTKIVGFDPRSPGTYFDSSLQARSTLKPETDDMQRATLEFNEVRCIDKGEYRWEVITMITQVMTVVGATMLDVKANTSFKTDGSLTYPANVNYMEGDAITFTCTGDVGSLPTGRMTWYYYTRVTAVATDVTGHAVQTSPVANTSACSFTRTSTLTLRLQREFNGFTVRCTVQQDTSTEEGDAHMQTQPINVQYVPSVNRIGTLPYETTYDVGTSEVTLTCSGDGNPPPTYSWVLPDNSGRNGANMTLQNLQLGMAGVYTCVASNAINGQNYTATRSASIAVTAVVEKREPTSCSTLADL